MDSRYLHYVLLIELKTKTSPKSFVCMIYQYLAELNLTSQILFNSDNLNLAYFCIITNIDIVQESNSDHLPTISLNIDHF